MKIFYNANELLQWPPYSYTFPSWFLEEKNIYLFYNLMYWYITILIMICTALPLTRPTFYISKKWYMRTHVKKNWLIDIWNDFPLYSIQKNILSIPNSGKDLWSYLQWGKFLFCNRVVVLWGKTVVALKVAAISRLFYKTIIGWGQG